MRLSFNYEFIFKQILEILHKSGPLSSFSVLLFRSMRRASFLRYRAHTEYRDFHDILFNQISGFSFPYLIFIQTLAIKRGDHRLCIYFGFDGICIHTYEITLSFLQSESRFYLQNVSGKSVFLFIVSIASSRHFRCYKLQQTYVSVCFFFNDHNFTSSELIVLSSTSTRVLLLRTKYLIFLVQVGSYLCLHLNVRYI